MNQKNTNWADRIRSELSKAEQARIEGNEGMARVCARRAAGIAAGEYLRRRNLLSHPLSAYELLKYLQSLPDISPNIREVAGHFLLRITQDHTLPVEADLIAEARWLARELLDPPHP